MKYLIPILILLAGCAPKPHVRWIQGSIVTHKNGEILSLDSHQFGLRDDGVVTWRAWDQKLRDAEYREQMSTPYK